MKAAAFLIVFIFIFSLTISSGALAEGPIDGVSLFNNYCAKCHGTGAIGTDKGPPLLHKIYRPNHHADSSFHRAVRKGVRQHHWPFGDMPPVEGVDKDEVEMIIEYVRELQREAGIL